MSSLLRTGAEMLLWMEARPLWTALVVTVVLMPGAACCWLAGRVAGLRLTHAGATYWGPGRRMRRIDRMQGRLDSLCTAVSLLTDSTETALRDTLVEMEYMSKVGRPAPPVRPAAGAAAPAAAMLDYGRTVREIALAEGVSEGEVRLRLRLQGAVRRPATAPLSVQ